MPIAAPLDIFGAQLRVPIRPITAWRAIGSFAASLPVRSVTPDRTFVAFSPRPPIALRLPRPIARDAISTLARLGKFPAIGSAVAALTEGRTPFDVKLVQMVRLLRAGEPVKMSKRAGNFVTLADVVREVGKDVVRFTMLTRKADAQMDFDFAKVVEASKDNPVFYVQYAHARVRSLQRKAAAEGMALPDAADLSLLDEMPP